MKRLTIGLLVLVGLLASATAARADWIPNAADPMDATNHKMHFPQMPDLDGWDVSFWSAHEFDPGVVPPYTAFAWPSGDDWQCAGTGSVTDIHF